MNKYINMGVDIHINTLQRHGYIGGSTGSGKSVSLMRMVEELHKTADTINIVFDSKGDLNKLSSLRKYDGNVVFYEINKNYSKTINAGVQFKLCLSGINIDDFISIADINQTQACILKTLCKLQGCSWDMYLNPKELYDKLNNKEYEIKRLYNFTSSSFMTLKNKIYGMYLDYGDYFYNNNETNYINIINDYYNVYGLDSYYSCDGTVNKSTFIINVADICENTTLYQLFCCFVMGAIKSTFKYETSDLKCTLFIDEAHLLFKDCSKGLIKNIETMVRTIRSKGVAMWFVTQGYNDLPIEIVTNLNTMIQHKLTGGDSKSLRAIAKVFKDINFANGHNLAINEYEGKLLTLARGEAMFMYMDDKGVTQPVLHYNVPAPEALNQEVFMNLTNKFHKNFKKVKFV